MPMYLECNDNSEILIQALNPSFGSYILIADSTETLPVCIEVEQEDIPPEYVLTIADGVLISGSIVLAWTIGWVGRMIIRSITKTRYA